jgi:hypothetical protein
LDKDIISEIDQNPKKLEAVEPGRAARYVEAQPAG